MIIRSRAPLRLGLAGGGTDVSPYCDVYGGKVLNATIDRYAYAVIKSIDEPIVRFVATDLQITESLSVNLPISLNGILDLHKTSYKIIMNEYNNGQLIPLELSTSCDAPAGSGLGSSSTLVVAMIRAFVELLDLPLDDYEIARLAFQIERVHCGLKGGRQDQYSATFGGFNFMEFGPNEHALITPLRIKNWIICELEASLVLYFTGISRESATIIDSQSNNLQSGSEEALNAMHRVRDQALIMKECVLRGNFQGFVDSMSIGWKNKKLSASMVSNSQINIVLDAALKKGALSGKVSGAGGGGFILFFVPSERRMDVMRELNRFGGQVSNCHFTEHGTQAWKID